MLNRDYDYIEARLLNPVEGAIEARGRLQQVGRDDLAARLLEAVKAFMDECRAIRTEFVISESRGT